MEPDVIRIYSSSPPPLEDGAEEEEDEFGDFGTFSGVPGSISFTEFDTPTTFNQTQALTATSPPELLNSRGLMGFSRSSNGTHNPTNQLSKANGVVPPSHPGSGPSERTEMKKVVSSSLGFPPSDTAGGELADCNGGGTEVLTNGFTTFDVQGSPSSLNSVHSHIKGTSSEDTGSVPVCSPEDDFADFAAFSNAEGHVCPTAGQAQVQDQDQDQEQAQDQDQDSPTGRSHDERCTLEQGTTSEDNVRDTNRTGPNTSGSDSISVPAETLDRDSLQRDVAFAQERSASEAACTNEPLPLTRVDVADGDESKDAAGCSEHDLSPDAAADSEAGQSDETETETSFGRPLSTDALEEYGDMSTTGSAPSPPLQGDTATPADHSQLAEDDEDFGDFGDADSFGAQGFADFEQQEPNGSHGSAAAQEAARTEDDDFGDFNSPKLHSCEREGGDGGQFADFPVSDSFGNFSSAVEAADGEADAGWSAFGEQQQQVEGESWAAFSTEQSVAPPAESRAGEGGEGGEGEEQEQEEWHETEAPAVSEEPSRTDRQSVRTGIKLTRFDRSFINLLSVSLLTSSSSRLIGRFRSVRGGVWTQLQDIHEAFGLRYQWGGSHCNKALLCCLGIDTRNILFTGQKKQPVIVPMYAASLVSLHIHTVLSVQSL
uniref:Aftiphilin a n=1 Tax=Seriola lalandi dorsalis TaxID=1841481 RepID=A0A3B4XCA7_SERLL